jgi:hypothetical protein
MGNTTTALTRWCVSYRMLLVIKMPRKRQGEILAQKVFMCPVSLLMALKEAAAKEGVSESEIIRQALRERLKV